MTEEKKELQEKKPRVKREHETEARAERVDDLVDKVIHVNRVAKVVKGGKRFGFAALVVVGDQKGRIGYAHAKAKEVPDAIKKATERAKQRLIRVPLREGRTLHHDALGHFGAGRVTLRTAPAGTGIIAGGPMRIIFETMGIQDIVAKCTGSSNPHNMVRATFDALTGTYSPRYIASKRGKKVGDVVACRDGSAAKETAEKGE